MLPCILVNTDFHQPTGHFGLKKTKTNKKKGYFDALWDGCQRVQCNIIEISIATCGDKRRLHCRYRCSIHIRIHTYPVGRQNAPWN